MVLSGMVFMYNNIVIKDVFIMFVFVRYVLFVVLIVISIVDIIRGEK